DGLTDGDDPDCAPACTVTEDPEVSCSDGIDNDCDELIDCADGDCSADAACSPSCQPVGAACTADADCCSNKCRGRPGGKTCKS
ncbi:MAG: hypothetical protein ACREMB_25380, partial [Candidatus Rokuibacteriota bacterium]